jgi:Ca2+-binding EF-hand superfamily protein
MTLSLFFLMPCSHADMADEEIRQMIRTVNLTNSGRISYEEFEKVFIADVKKSASL